MSTLWWICAFAIIAGYIWLNNLGSAYVKHRTGRESPPDPSARNSYDLIFFGVSFAIGLPPIWLLPDYDPLVYSALLFVGLTAGALLAQAYCGRKVSI